MAIRRDSPHIGPQATRITFDHFLDLTRFISHIPKKAEDISTEWTPNALRSLVYLHAECWLLVLFFSFFEIRDYDLFQLRKIQCIQYKHLQVYLYAVYVSLSSSFLFVAFTIYSYSYRCTLNALQQKAKKKECDESITWVLKKWEKEENAEIFMCKHFLFILYVFEFFFISFILLLQWVFFLRYFFRLQ